MVKGLGIKDFRESTGVLGSAESLTSPRGIADLITNLVPEPVLRYANKSAFNADPQTKFLIELLRAGTARGPQEIFQEVRNQNAP